MKPIIIDMKDMSDSIEIYKSRPNRFMIYTMYVILLMFTITLLWMRFSKIEIVVICNGVFKGSNAKYEISSGVTGRVKENYVIDGQYVKEGDVLYVISVDGLSESINNYQNKLKDSKDRVEILFAYERSLEGDKNELEECADNPYYNEFINRRELLYANIELDENDISGQATLYEGNVESISNTIEIYNDKINKLNTVKQCILSQNNMFDSSDSYYHSLVSSYIVTYEYTSLKYDNQIYEYQKQIDEYQNKIDEYEQNNEITEGEFSASGMVIDNDIFDVESLKQQRDSIIIARDSLSREKNQALLNLELQQIATIEQQIINYSDTILSFETNLSSAKLQLGLLNNEDSDIKVDVAILTEKALIASEVLKYEEIVDECELYLKSYQIQGDNCIITANFSGYFYSILDIKIGTYVTEGVGIGTIYPEMESDYYAEIYVKNSDISKIKEGQKVKFEIETYPSSEYGYFAGVVENIAKDAFIDPNTGHAYYIVKVKCDNMTGEDNDEGYLMNGMACQAKIVVDKKTILAYILEKIDLLKW